MALTQTQQDQIKSLSDAYFKAKEAGDSAGMLAANQQANAIRSGSGVQAVNASVDIGNVQKVNTPTAPAPVSAPTSNTSALSDEYMSLRNKIVSGNGTISDVDRMRSLNISANQQRGLGDNVVTSGVDLNYLQGLVPQTKTINQKVDPNGYMTELINTLLNSTNALNSTSGLKSMDWTTALTQAKDRLNPLYEDAARDTMAAVNKHNLVRGFYGQLPGEAIKADQMQKTYNTREAAIADLANAIINNDFNQQYQITNANRAAYNDRLSAITNAINAVMGYENQGLNKTAKEAEIARINQQLAAGEIDIATAKKRLEAAKAGGTSTGGTSGGAYDDGLGAYFTGKQ